MHEEDELEETVLGDTSLPSRQAVSVEADVTLGLVSIPRPSTVHDINFLVG